jgi:uncharacterized membrane protein
MRNVYSMWKTLLLIALIMLLLDAMYLTATRSIFGAVVAKIQRVAMLFRLEGAVIVYALLVFGLYKFIISERRPVKDAAILGLVIYGVFDFTNYAMFKNYDMATALMDTAWGSILMALTTYLVYQVM